MSKRIFCWNKQRSEIITKPKDNNLDKLIDLSFKNINRWFVFSFKNNDDDPIRNSFVKYYMTLVEIKDFNALLNK